MQFRLRHYVLLALAILAAHELGSILHLPGSRVPILWADSGIVFAALLLAERRQWPGILAISAAALWVHIGLIRPGGFLLATVFGLALPLAGLVGSALFGLGARLPLTQLGVRELTLLTLVCILGGNLLGSAIESLSVHLMFGAPLGGSILSLWLAKIVGALAVGPVILWRALGSGRPARSRARDRGAWPELVLLSIATLAGIAFSVGPAAGPAQSLLDFPYAVMIVVLWGIVRFDMSVVGAQVLVLVVSATATASLGEGPFIVGGQAPRVHVLSLQVYLLGSVAASYFLMVIVAERNFSFLTLARSAGMHRALTENAVDMTLVIQADGEVRYLSPSIKRVMGYDAGEMPKGWVWTVVHPDDAAAMAEVRNEAAAQPSSPIAFGDIRIERSDGSYRYVEGTLTNLLDEPGIEGLVINCRDITTRKAAEARIVESEQRFRMIAEAMPIPLFVSVLETGRFLYGNHHALETLGISGSIIGAAAGDFFADPTRRRELVAQARATGRVDDFEVTLRRNDGTTITGSVTGQAFEYQGEEALITAFFDITDRKAAEEALRDSEDRYRALVEGSFQGIAVSVDGRLVEANRGFADMMGYDSPEEMDGLTPNELIAAASVGRAWRYIREGGTEPTELVGLRKDGSEFPIEVRARPTLYRGEPARITAFRDISERVVFAAQKKKLEDQLRQSQKMESIGTLAGGIAHDFNNILLPIIGYAELTRDELADRPQASAYLDEVLSATKRARDLVAQILQFSRHQDPELKPVQIEITVRDALKLLRATTPSTIEIKTDVEAAPLTIMADQGQIHQIVLNLGTNAIHAIGERNGEITVSLAGIELDAELAEWVGVSPGPHVRLTFADTGRGISEKVIDRIFDPFFTTKGVGRGTGLGLSAVHGIVMSHGGGMRVQSEPGHGATFEVYFPRVDPEATRRDSGARPKELPVGSERILFVDDEPQVTALAERVLTGLGYDVYCTTDSVHALEIVTADPGRFDLLFTDQTMPHLSGLDLIERVHEVRPGLPVVLATGFSESVTDERLKDKQVDSLLMKPYRRQELAFTVRAALDRDAGED